MLKINHRRRAIKLMAAGAVSLSSSMPTMAAIFAKKMALHEWHGTALGAEVSLQLYHEDASKAQKVIQGSVKILKEMEALFSLYQTDSILVKLNQEGRVDQPPREFVDLLRYAHRISHLTSGAFDITVQPLWQFYNRYFSDPKKQEETVPEAALKAVLELVGYRRITISDQRISFNRPNMSATLNGIAQGFVTDHIAEYLRQEGLTSVLVDMGEFRAIGGQGDGSPWRIGLADPVHFGGIADILKIQNLSVATSAAFGEHFDLSGQYHHLIDPKRGKSANEYLSVTVTAPEATLADALSTAFYSMSEDGIKNCLKFVPSAKVRITRKDGTLLII